MSGSVIGRLRLMSQGVARPNFAAPEDVVAWMGAMQAQDYHQCVWALGARSPSSTLVGVEQAIADGKILRTWPMRGTIHLVPPEDAKWMVQLSADRMIAKDKRRLEQLELDNTILGRSKALIYDMLAGQGPRTRSDILATLEAAGIRTDGARGYHILWHMAHGAVICLGPLAGKEQTFVLLDEWVPRSRELTREEALVELAKRYFISHGPATVQDFAWWAGLTLTEARQGLSGASKALVKERIDGTDYWLSPHSPDEKDAFGVYILPGFDEFFLGYTDRSAVLEAQHAAKVCPGGNGVFYPMIVVDGQIVGTWKRAIKKQTVTITREAFDGLTTAQVEAFEQAAQCYAAFLGLRAVFES